jgi:hypothetical protein
MPSRSTLNELKDNINILQAHVLRLRHSLIHREHNLLLAVQQASADADEHIVSTQGNTSNQPPVEGSLNTSRFVVTVSYPKLSPSDTHADVVCDMFCDRHEIIMDQACEIARTVQQAQRHLGFCAMLPCVTSEHWIQTKNDNTVLHKESECSLQMCSFSTRNEDKTPLELRVQKVEKAGKIICMSLMISAAIDKTFQCAVHLRCGVMTSCERTENNYASLVHHCKSDKTWIMRTDLCKQDSVHMLGHCFHVIRKFMPRIRRDVINKDIHLLAQIDQLCVFRLGTLDQNDTFLAFNWRLNGNSALEHGVCHDTATEHIKIKKDSSVPEHVQAARERVLQQYGLSSN